MKAARLQMRPDAAAAAVNRRWNIDCGEGFYGNEVNILVWPNRLRDLRTDELHLNWSDIRVNIRLKV
jgi:hypothetical protein